MLNFNENYIIRTVLTIIINTSTSTLSLITGSPSSKEQLQSIIRTTAYPIYILQSVIVDYIYILIIHIHVMYFQRACAGTLHAIQEM